MLDTAGGNRLELLYRRFYPQWLGAMSTVLLHQSWLTQNRTKMGKGVMTLTLGHGLGALATPQQYKA